MTTNPTNSTVLKLIIPLSFLHPYKVIKLYGVEGGSGGHCTLACSILQDNAVHYCTVKSGAAENIWLWIKGLEGTGHRTVLWPSGIRAERRDGGRGYRLAKLLTLNNRIINQTHAFTIFLLMSVFLFVSCIA